MPVPRICLGARTEGHKVVPTRVWGIIFHNLLLFVAGVWRTSQNDRCRLPDQQFAFVQPNRLRVLKPSLRAASLRSDRHGATYGLHLFTHDPSDVAWNCLSICIVWDRQDELIMYECVHDVASSDQFIECQLSTIRSQPLKGCVTCGRERYSFREYVLLAS